MDRRASPLNQGGAFASAPASASSPATTRAARRPGARRPTARGLAFAPKGYRLAIEPLQRRDAVVSQPRGQARARWNGRARISTSPGRPTARFLVTSMQENALHGWRLQPDKGNMRMSGYPSKTRSVSWSHDGNWLATSGAEAAILWPSSPRKARWARRRANAACAPPRSRRVAFHPNAFVLAVGYEDGCILLIRLTDALRAPGPACAERQRCHGARLGQGRASALPSAARTAKPAS